MEQLANLPTNLRDLHGLWARVATRWFDGQLWAPIVVWYMSLIHYRICEAPQTVWLSEGVGGWGEGIRRSWRPFYDDTEDDEIVLIAPQPLDLDAGFIARILLVQHFEADHEAAALVTLNDDGHPHNLVEKQAMVLPICTTHELLLSVID